MKKKKKVFKREPYRRKQENKALESFVAQAPADFEKVKPKKKKKV